MQTRLALIGTGRWGKNIEKTVASLPDCVLTHTATHDWKHLLEVDDIDGVCIATPPSSHTEIALAFIERGIPVFIEKPMTLSVKDADAIVTASEQKNVPVMVGHIHLYNPAYETLKASLSAIGTIGRIEGCEAHDGPVRPDYSTLWDSMPHDLSMMIDLLGMPISVQAEGNARTRPDTKLYDDARMELTFSNGATGTVESNWLSKEKVRIFTVIGEQGRITIDDTLPKDKVTMTDEAGTRALPYTDERPLTRELQAFVSVIRTKEVHRSRATDGRNTVVILEAAEQSIKQGGVAVSV
jgi:UDP-N-acetylglucosamine 3-dehydrogenase